MGVISFLLVPISPNLRLDIRAVDSGAEFPDHPVCQLALRLLVDPLGQEGFFIKSGGLYDPNPGGLLNSLHIGRIPPHAVVGHIYDGAYPQLIEPTVLLLGLLKTVQPAVGILLDPAEVDGGMLMHQCIAVHDLLLFAGQTPTRRPGIKRGDPKGPPFGH